MMKAILVGGLSIGFAASAFAAGRIEGTFTNPASGSMLRCAARVLDAAGKAVATWARPSVRYEFDLPGGAYTIVCKLGGFKEFRAPVQVAEGKTAVQSFTLEQEASTRQQGLQKPSAGAATAARRMGRGWARIPRGDGPKQKGTPEAPTGPTGFLRGVFTGEGGSRVICRALDVKASNGAVVKTGYKPASRFEMSLPASAYNITCQPQPGYKSLTQKISVVAGKEHSLDFKLSK